MSRLQEALSALTELLTDTQFISHPYTDSHVAEVRRRGVRIGAGLTTQEDRNKYTAVLEVGMAAVAKVQKRNSIDVPQSSTWVGIAGVESDAPRWEEKLESLEYSLGSYGLDFKRSGDDSLVVSAHVKNYVDAKAVPAQVVASRLKQQNTVVLSGSDKKRAVAACEDTYLSSVVASDSDTINLGKDDMLVFLDCLASQDSCERLHAHVLEGLGITVGVA